MDFMPKLMKEYYNSSDKRAGVSMGGNELDLLKKKFAKLKRQGDSGESAIEPFVEEMAEGVALLDERGEVLFANLRIKEILGFDSEEVVTAKALIEKMKKTGVYDVFLEGRGTRSVVITGALVPGPAGEMSLRCEVSSVADLDGQAVGFVLILRDITREEELDKMKTEFISTVSHELRTPLATMKEFASIMSDEIAGKLTQEQKDYIDIIKGNIDRLTRLINNLLDISKIEAGKTELKKAYVDIAHLARTIISGLKFEADGKQVEIQSVFPEAPLHIYADPDKIIQIFTNLISNAIKFTPEKGKVTVEIRDREKEIECSVSDTGKGIALEDMGKLFSKFQQIGREAGSGAKGTGLGLAISKELVEMHNGQIRAESKVGQGSKFVFLLPKYTAKALLEDYVGQYIKGALKSGSKLSIVTIFSVEDVQLGQDLPVEKHQLILKEMEAVLNKTLRRKDDRVFKDDDEIVVVLLNCEKEGALKTQDRIKQILKDHLTGQGMDQKIRFRIGCATFPDEAEDASKLIARTRENCRLSE